MLNKAPLIQANYGLSSHVPNNEYEIGNKLNSNNINPQNMQAKLNVNDVIDTLTNCIDRKNFDQIMEKLNKKVLGERVQFYEEEINVKKNKIPNFNLNRNETQMGNPMYNQMVNQMGNQLGNQLGNQTSNLNYGSNRDNDPNSPKQNYRNNNMNTNYQMNYNTNNQLINNNTNTKNNTK